MRSGSSMAVRSRCVSPGGAARSPRRTASSWNRDWRAFRTRPDPQAGRSEFRLEPGITPIPVGSAPVLAGKSYTISAALRGRRAGDEGVLIANGDNHSGYTLYVQDERLVYERMKATLGANVPVQPLLVPVACGGGDDGGGGGALGRSR